MTSVYVGDKKFNKHFDTLSLSGRDDEAAEKKENFIFGVESGKKEQRRVDGNVRSPLNC